MNITEMTALLRITIRDDGQNEALAPPPTSQLEFSLASSTMHARKTVDVEVARPPTVVNLLPWFLPRREYLRALCRTPAPNRLPDRQSLSGGDRLCGSFRL